MVPDIRWLLACLLAFSLLGCQTFRSWEQGCAAIYSGVRYYSSQLGEVPPDGKLFFTLDLPLTAVVDTLALPATAFMDPVAPSGGFSPGCRWAN